MKNILLASTILTMTAMAPTAKAQSLLGAYIGTPGENQDAANDYSAFSNTIGTPTVLTEYVDSTGPMSTWAASAQWSADLLAKTPNAASTIPSIGIPMTQAGQDADTAFKAIASGSEDGVINGIFQAYANDGFKNFYIRPGWEMNGNWQPWSVTPANAADFNAAFQRISMLAHSFQDATIQTVWNPAAGGGWNGPIDTNSYYPGNSAVDVIGLDQYAANGASPTAPLDNTTDPAQFTLNDALAMAKANNKPFALPEVGAASDDTTFPGTMASVIKASGVPIAYAAVWDCVCGGTVSLKPTNDSAAAAAWKQALNDIGVNTASGPTTLSPSTSPTTTAPSMVAGVPPSASTQGPQETPTSSSPVSTPSPVTHQGPAAVQEPDTLSPTTFTAPTQVSDCGTGQSAGGTISSTLIPGGYLHTSGNQILDDANESIRIASVGVNGAVSLDNIDGMMQQIVLDGFNTIRLPWYNASHVGDIAMYDKYVASAGKYGIRVILDQHANESPAPNNGYLPNQPNGLPVDQGPGTDGTDGAGDAGTVNLARYVSDWSEVAQHYAGNPTVIGFDLHNEPLEYGVGGKVTWGDGGPKDILAMYKAAADTIQAVNPDALIIAAGPISYTGNYAGTGDAPSGDLSLVPTKPLTLKIPNKVVYTVHEYPAYIGGYMPQSGSDKVAVMNAGWGLVVSQNIAPVWIGEMGASMSAADGEDTGQTQAWAQTITDYVNGKFAAQGGPTVAAGQQGPGTDWWSWGNLDGETPNGTLDSSGKVRAEQEAVYSQLRQSPLTCSAQSTPPVGLTPPTAQQTNEAITNIKAGLPDTNQSITTPTASVNAGLTQLQKDGESLQQAIDALQNPSGSSTSPQTDQQDIVTGDALIQGAIAAVKAARPAAATQ